MWLGVDPSNRNPVSKGNERAPTSPAQSTEGASRKVVELLEYYSQEEAWLRLSPRQPGPQHPGHNISQWSFKSLVRKYINKNKTHELVKVQGVEVHFIYFYF